MSCSTSHFYLSRPLHSCSTQLNHSTFSDHCFLSSSTSLHKPNHPPKPLPMSARSEIGTGTRRATNDKRTSVLQKQNSKRPTTHHQGNNNNNKAKCTTCSFKRSESSPSPSSAIRYLKLLGGKMVAAFRMMSPKRSRKGSRKVTSSESTAKPPAPPPPPPALDSHRAEAIDDCIQFINSSSLPRSNSVSCQG